MHNPHCRFAAFYARLIPKPVSFFQSPGAFTISADIKIFPQKNNREITAIADLLSTYLQEVCGDAALVSDADSVQGAGNIQLLLNGDPGSGEEGYELSITTDAILLRGLPGRVILWSPDSSATPARPTFRESPPSRRFDPRYAPI